MNIRRCRNVFLGMLFGLIAGCVNNASPLIMPSASSESSADSLLPSKPAQPEISIRPAPQLHPIHNPLNPVVSDNILAFEPIQNDVEWHDIWERIPDGYAIPQQNHERIERELAAYIRSPDYLNRVSKRANPYLYHIVEEIERRGMPLELALLPIVESAYQPFAYSPSRAAGVWQFIPGTAHRYGLKINWWYDGRRDVFAATDAALNYLQDLHDKFDDWLLALAAYNAGEGTVGRAIRRNLKLGKATDFWSLPLPRETRHYVPRLLAVAKIVAKPDHFGIALEPVSNAPQLARIDTGSQIDLALVEELSEVPIETIYQLNPGINQWATDPSGPHHIVLPLDKAEQFEFALAQHPESKRVTWQRHRIRAGETLSHIADTYRTRVSVLKQVNNLRGNTIRAGHDLMIPVAAKSAERYVLSADQRIARSQNAGSGYKVNYTVRRGDSLWKIANRYGVSVSQVTRWNGLSKKDILRPGRKLVVWPHGQRKVQAKADSGTTHYTVRRGDSLDRISRRFKVSVNDLVNWNALDKSKYLQPGQTLIVQADAS